MSLISDAKFSIGADTEFGIVPHGTGTLDVVLRDPILGGNRLILAFTDPADLDRFIAAVVAARPGPPREQSAERHPQGTHIPDPREAS